MNRLIFSGFIFLSLLQACGGGANEKNKGFTETGEMKESEFLDTCQCKNLESDSTGIYYKNGKKFTGICLDYYPGTTDKYIEQNLLNGQLHGKVTYFGKEGEVLIEEIYENGQKKRSGEVDVLNCACTELTKEETHVPQVPYRYLLDNIPYTGSCHEYYPESDQIYVEMNYKDGLLDGHMVYYNKDGSTLMIEKYEKGIQISAVH